MQCLQLRCNTICRQREGLALTMTLRWRRCIFDVTTNNYFIKLCRRPPQYDPAPCKLTFDLLTLKVVSESRVTWATSVSILVSLGLSVLDLGPVYATDRLTSDVRRASSLNAPYPRGGDIIINDEQKSSSEIYKPQSHPIPSHPIPSHPNPNPNPNPRQTRVIA